MQRVGVFAGNMDDTFCEAEWALPGASVGREEALADALALKRGATDAAEICGSRILEIVKLTAA